jgi:hypothetical protein
MPTYTLFFFMTRVAAARYCCMQLVNHAHAREGCISGIYRSRDYESTKSRKGAKAHASEDCQITNGCIYLGTINRSSIGCNLCTYVPCWCAHQTTNFTRRRPSGNHVREKHSLLVAAAEGCKEDNDWEIFDDAQMTRDYSRFNDWWVWFDLTNRLFEYSTNYF